MFRAFLIGSVAGLFGNLCGAAADDATAVRAIVEKAVQAVGGKDKLLRIFSWKEKGFIGGVNPFARDVVVRPPDVWLQGGRNIAEGNADRRQKTYLVWCWTLAPLLQADSELSPLPDATVEGRPAAGVKLRRKGELDVNFFFDKETGLLVRNDWRGLEIRYGEWKEHDGVKYPAKAFCFRNGKDHVKTEFIEIKRLAELPAVKSK
jgi:hypothetical protein